MASKGLKNQIRLFTAKSLGKPTNESVDKYTLLENNASVNKLIILQSEVFG
jgi:hypothetical protein